MTKAEFVEKIHAKLPDHSKAKTEEALNAVVDTIREVLVAGESVTLMGFGTFKVVERAAREARNPRTGETIKVPACKAPKFTPGKTFKDALK